MLLFSLENYKTEFLIAFFNSVENIHGVSGTLMFLPLCLAIGSLKRERAMMDHSASIYWLRTTTRKIYFFSSLNM